MQPPYPPSTAQLGGVPTAQVDVPVASVFLLLYIACAAGHITIFKTNKKKGHKFFMSAMLFGYCMCRNVSMILRIVWACYPASVQLGIAASVFISAGILILYLVNLQFAQRILRATHPLLGWHKGFSGMFIALYASVPIVLIAINTATFQSYFTLDKDILQIDNEIRLVAVTYLLVFSLLPLVLMALNSALPVAGKSPMDKFGTGRWRLKIAVLLFSSILLVSGAAFRCITGFFPPRSVDRPAWYDSKACFWIFDVGVEIIVAYLYIIARVDLRFYVPDGASAPGMYSMERVNYLVEDPDYIMGGDESSSEARRHEKKMAARGRLRKYSSLDLQRLRSTSEPRTLSLRARANLDEEDWGADQSVVELRKL